MKTRTWDTVCAELAEPFKDEDVFWRIDRAYGNWARVLCYLDARAVMDRLDATVGPENWQDSYRETASGKNICELSIRTKATESWVTKSDGAGNTNIEGDKGGLSDAFKRAGVKWGIGRDLYSLGETKVNLSSDRPKCPKHYLVVASKRGQDTKYGVAPSLVQLHKDRILDSIRAILGNEMVDRGDIPLIFQAASSTLKDGHFTSAGIIGVPPKELSYDQLKTILNRLSFWNNTGVFRQKIQDYIAFTKVSGDVV